MSQLVGEDLLLRVGREVVTLATPLADRADDAADELLKRGAVARGDLVVFTKGDFSGVTGGTNGLKIERVGG